MPARKDLGSLLVDEDVLDPKDLERVRDASPLWKALVERELASPELIFRTLSSRFGVAVVSDERLGDVQVPDKLRRLISRGEAQALGLLPVDLTADGQRATVVMIDPSDEATLALFLTRAQVPEGRALLGRQGPLMRAIDRCLAGGDTAVVSPLPPPRRRALKPADVPPSTPLPLSPQMAPMPQMPMPQMPMPQMMVDEDDVTGTVELDPGLQAEMQKLPPRALKADPLTPLPRPLPPRPKRPTPPPTPPPIAESAPTTQAQTAPAQTAAPAETPSEALRAEERLTRALVETVEALATELEARMGGAGSGAEMARLARRVARQLNLPRRAADEVGVAAQLYAVDRALRAVDGTSAPDLFGALGWSASADGGLLPMLRALTAASAGFARGVAGVSIGVRIISAVADYLELGAASHAPPDLGTVSQLLRASASGAQVVDALLRVLQDERGDITPAEPTTLPATSVLKHVTAGEATPEPGSIGLEPAARDQTRDAARDAVSDSDKTQRRPMPQRPKKADEQGE